MGFRSKKKQETTATEPLWGNTTVSMGFKGLVVGGSEFHKEKVDIFVSKTVNYVEGETPEQTKARVAKTDELELILFDSVSSTVAKKIQKIRNHVAAQQVKHQQDRA